MRVLLSVRKDFRKVNEDISKTDETTDIEAVERSMIMRGAICSSVRPIMAIRGVFNVDRGSRLLYERGETR